MEKFKLALGLHNHQPVGNFDHVFEEAHNLAYLPFLKILEKFKNIRLSLHQSGILWDWQEKNHPEYFKLVQKLINNKQIELVTGGFYEPILPSIPDRDKLGQIKLLNDYLQRKFNVKTSGLWLTERVWEPHLPKILGQAGVKYIPIDDTHFIYAGFEQEDLKGVFVTEEEGVALKLLPIQKKLRYLIPFGTVDNVIKELKRQAGKNPEGMAVYADDGEKFGVWPETHQHCYKDGWLEAMFKALEENSDWLEVCTLGEAAMEKPVGPAYLQSASYAEMLHWALPTRAYTEYENFENWLRENGKLEQYGRFVRGGHWRGFLTKYPESNLMHKKMLSISNRLKEYETANPNETDTIQEARNNLYAGQCNCPYWHGVFGGLYLPHLRQAIYENLIKAEKLLIGHDLNRIEKAVFDYDNDGNDEVIVITNKFSTIIKPATGGIIAELDCFEGNFNFTDTLSRRKEGYHNKLSGAKLKDVENSNGFGSIHDLVLAKEGGLDKFLAEDWYIRRCFIDHFLSPKTDIEAFLSGQFHDQGNFIVEPYTCDRDSNIEMVVLRREGSLWQNGNPKTLRIEKGFYFNLESDVISVNYNLTAPDDNIDNIRFAVENNFNFQAGHADDRYSLFDGKRIEGGYLDAAVAQKDCLTVVFRDDWRKLAMALSVDRNTDVWQVPIFTISLSEGGFEKVYQGTSLMHVFNIDLRKGKPFEICFLLFAGKTENMPNRFRRVKGERAIVNN